MIIFINFMTNVCTKGKNALALWEKSPASSRDRFRRSDPFLIKKVCQSFEKLFFYVKIKNYSTSILNTLSTSYKTSQASLYYEDNSITTKSSRMVV